MSGVQYCTLYDQGTTEGTAESWAAMAWCAAPAGMALLALASKPSAPAPTDAPTGSRNAGAGKPSGASVVLSLRLGAMELGMAMGTAEANGMVATACPW